MYRKVCFHVKYLFSISYILAVELLQSGLLQLKTNWITYILHGCFCISQDVCDLFTVIRMECCVKKDLYNNKTQGAWCCVKKGFMMMQCHISVIQHTCAEITESKKQRVLSMS